MADNVVSDPGAGGASWATDDVSGNHYLRIKLADGTADSSTPIHSGGGVEANALRVTIANDSTGVVSIDDNGASLTVDDGGGSLTVDGSVTADTELPAAAALADNMGNPTTPLIGGVVVGFDGTNYDRIRGDSTDGLDVDVTRLPALPAGNNNIGDVDVASIAAGTNLIGDVAIQARTTGGLSVGRFTDIDETDDDVKASAGKVHGWYLYNDGVAEVYVHFYNTNSPTVGTTTPVMSLPIPAGSAANAFTDIGIAGFGTAISIAATNVFDGTGAPALNQVHGSIFYI